MDTKQLENSINQYDSLREAIKRLQTSLEVDTKTRKALDEDFQTDPQQLHNLVKKVEGRIEESEFQITVIDKRVREVVLEIRGSHQSVDSDFAIKQHENSIQRSKDRKKLLASQKTTDAIEHILDLWKVYPHGWDAFLKAINLSYEPLRLVSARPATLESELTALLSRPEVLLQADVILERHQNDYIAPESSVSHKIYIDDESDDEAVA